MDKSSITEQDYLGAISALREYDDLSYLTNGPGFLIDVCNAYVKNSGDVGAQMTLATVLAERGYRPPHPSAYNHWDDPLDGIDTPPTFA